MYIYLLIKVIFEILRHNNKKFSYIKYLFNLFELFIIFFYCLFIYNNEFYLFFYGLFAWCLFWVLLFLFYKGLNIILLKFEKIISWIEKGERIKEILLSPKVNKIIYYFVWSLPWNLPYWIYFWIMENGWYFRVWVNSNRDIILMKYLGWDSRNFFFKINKSFFENKFSVFGFFFKYTIFINIMRCLLILSIFRKNWLNSNILIYVFNRMFVFCYISLFYIFFFENIFIFNRILLFIIFVIELSIIFFLDFLINKLMLSRYKSIFDNFDIKYLSFLIDPINGDKNVIVPLFFEVNNQVWNVILGNSVSLNILKQYMLWVNKNTKGYYYKEMDILPKHNIVKLFEISSIPFDILPRTRYVIMNLRSINNNFFKNQIIFKDSGFVMPDHRIRNMKNLYLSYFEKTYAVDSSVLSIIFLLRMNFPINYTHLYAVYRNSFSEPCGRMINYIMVNQKSALWRLRLAEINKANPELFNICYLLNSFKVEKQLYDIEYFFMTDFFGNDIGKKIPKIGFNGSIKEYKENMKLLTHFVLYEEEGIIWNPVVVDYLDGLNKNLKNKRKEYNEFFMSFFKLTYDYEIIVNLKKEFESKQDMINEIKIAYKLEFNKGLDFDIVLDLDLLEMKKLDLKIEKIGVLEASLLLYCLDLINKLESLSIKDVKNPKYSFLFE